MDFNLIRIWNLLNRGKKMYVKTVHNRIDKNLLTEEQLKDPEIKKEIDEHQSLEIKNLVHEEYVKILDLFVEKGYVTRSKETIYKIKIAFECYPYSPSLKPNGIMGIKGEKMYHTEDRLFQEKEYENFLETANELKIQIDLGYHRHIDSFEYQLLFSYETLVYTVNDRYFDIIEINYDKSTRTYKIGIVQPDCSLEGGKYRKKWIPIAHTDIDFLDGSKRIDPIIDCVEWKKEYVGLLVSNNEPYRILDVSKNKEVSLKLNDEENEDNVNYLSKEVFEINNFFSRIFEDASADHLRKQGYIADIRKRVDDAEIDIIAKKENRKLYCECKFRMKFTKNVPTNEIESFLNKKKHILQKKEEDGYNPEFYVITNSLELSQETLDFCKTNDIHVLRAKIDNNWKRNSLWKVKGTELII